MKEMRKFIVGMLLGLGIFSVTFGCAITQAIEVRGEKEVKEVKEVKDLIDMAQVTNIEVTETGTLLTFLNGTGYYWESEENEEEGEEKEMSKKEQEEKQEVSKDWINMNQVTNIKEENGVFTITVKIGNDYHDYVWEN